MRMLFVIILVVISASYLNSQNKRDYRWLMGNDKSVEPGIQAYEFNFNNKTFEVELRSGETSFDQNNTSICTEDGQLLFYSNGCMVANAEHVLMENGDSINEGLFFEELWLGDCVYGYPGLQDIITLPDPANPTGYYILHKSLEYSPELDPSVYTQDIKYTYVDMALVEGLGAVTQKNTSFYSGKPLWSYLTSISHSNGSYYWIIQPEKDSNCFITFLLDIEGLSLSSKQYVGVEFDSIHADASGDAKFSPDGKLYAYYNKYDGLQVFDFDREIGALTNSRHYQTHNPEFASFSSIEFSSNSRFLYFMTHDSIWQADLTYENLEEGIELIDVWNGIHDPNPTTFFKAALAPDCRIYIRSGSSTRSFHIINKPNEKGISCDFVQQGIELPFTGGTESWPNFPRFRVDEEEKCDPSIVSIFGETVYYRRDIEIFPNPVSNSINLIIPEVVHSGRIRIFNNAGQIVYEQHHEYMEPQLEIPIENLPSGTYVIELYPDDRNKQLFYSQRFVKLE